MAIIKTIKEEPFKDGLRWQAPDHFATDAEKGTDSYWKRAMDYYATMAMGQYGRSIDKIVPNYKLLKGFLTQKDFYEDTRKSLVTEAQSLMDVLEEDLELPGFVKHYPILNPPINTMIGEMSKRPDNARVKAFDDESQAEHQQALTGMYQQYMEQIIRDRVLARMIAQGQPTEGMEDMAEELERVTEEQMAKFRTTFSTMAERWGNRMLEAMKLNLQIKEKAEEGFRDMLISARQYIHIQPNGSKLGFGLEVENPKNVWVLTTEGKKYTRDAYAAGTLHVMELSEIIHLYPFLTKKEIDRLNEQSREYYDNPTDYISPLVQKNPTTGVNSIDYHVYDPAIEDRRREIEAKMMAEELDEYMGMANSVGHYGDKFTVIKAYWQSKKQMGKLTYLDENGQELTRLVDETYKKIPEEVSIEWGYINQWYEGLKIGEEIYYVQPLDILDYCPIIGVVHENKNTPAASLVDLMKPYQMIFNLIMNQLWRLLEKEKGKIFLTSLRTMPTPKDGSDQDAIDMWMLEAEERGVVFVDDSPENTKSASGFNQHAVHDWTRSQEMQTRLAMAEQIKNECWELVGLSRQRLGATTSSETAQAINTALTQSYAQTEPYFVQHEYLWNQVYQAILDAAMHVELTKPQSTISYISGEGENQFIQLNREDLALRDLQVFVTSRGEDQRIFSELRALAQPMLQNGAGYDVILELYTTNSVRQIKDTIRSFQKKTEDIQAQAQAQKQQELEQQQAQFEASLAQAEAQKAADLENENYNKELDRLNKKEVAIIAALGFGQQSGEDADGNGVPDIYQTTQLAQAQQKIQQDHAVNLQKQQLAGQQQMSNNALKQAQIDLQHEKIALEKKQMAQQQKQHEDKIAVARMAKKSPPKKKK